MSLIAGGTKAFPIEKEIGWDGQELSITFQADTGSVICAVPRDTVHGISIYNNAVGSDICDRLRRAALNKIDLEATRKSIGGSVSA